MLVKQHAHRGVTTVMTKEDQIITFKTFYDPMLAQIVRAKLEANGIECFLSDESMAAFNPLFDSTTGGVKLNILAKDLQLATQIADADDAIE